MINKVVVRALKTATAIIVTDTLHELIRSEHTRGLGDGAFGMQPFRLNRIEPGALDRQLADDEPTGTCAVKCIISHTRKQQVTALTGRFSTKRSCIWLVAGRWRP